MRLNGQTDPTFIAESWLDEGRRVALATVVRAWGSAPRPLGSHLIIDADGNFEGSVSGGCVEGDVIAAAAEVLETGQPALLEFGVSNEIAWRAGLSCGGSIGIFVEEILDPSIIRMINSHRRHRQACATLVDLEKGGMIVAPGGASAPEYGHSAIPADAFARAPQLYTDADRNIFINVYRPRVRLILIGAVHISQSLIVIAGNLGWETVVIDPRSGFASEERFPSAHLIPEWPQDAMRTIALDETTALAALTHEPRIDDFPLRKALEAGCFYVGALGSQKTHQKRIERLLASGLEPRLIDRIEAPIGLDIGATTPEEIAIAIAAQIINTQRKGALAWRSA